MYNCITLEAGPNPALLLLLLAPPAVAADPGRVPLPAVLARLLAVAAAAGGAADALLPVAALPLPLVEPVAAAALAAGVDFAGPAAEPGFALDGFGCCLAAAASGALLPLQPLLPAGRNVLAAPCTAPGAPAFSGLSAMNCPLYTLPSSKTYTPWPCLRPCCHWPS